MNPRKSFYGREAELNLLRRYLKKVSASLLVVKGRLCIGKSRLITEFVRGYKVLSFIGLPPDDRTTAQDQRDYFYQQMKQQLGIEGLSAEDWADLFWHLAKYVEEGRVILVLDEINWMGSLDNTFLGKLKSAWDQHFKQNDELLFILSGSMSKWIEDNILSSTGFMGRISQEITLRELPLRICVQFWRSHANQVSAYEIFKMLSVTGGVPRYLEEIDPDKSAEENIQLLAFTQGGVLVKEFERIFSDLFTQRSSRYKQIVNFLAKGPANLAQICEAIQMEKGGTVSQYLDDLVETGYLARDKMWNLKTGATSNLARYRLRHNYLRFYLKTIEPNLDKIEKGRLKHALAWHTIMGLQFENLVLNNAEEIHSLLHIDPGEIINDGPYFQRATSTQAGCQIDYLIQTKFSTLYLIEIKFARDSIGKEVIHEVEEKTKRLQRAKNFSIRPVLIHVNGVKSSVLEAGYFAKIIDFAELLA